MLNLILAMTFSMMITVIMRISEKYTQAEVAMLAANYLACAVMGILFTGTELFPSADGLYTTLGLGVFNGALFLGSFMLLKWNISRNGVVLPATFMRLGVLVPTFLSIFAFGEKPGAVQIIGIVLALCAIVLMQGRGAGKAESIGGLVILLIAGGCADAMSKVFEVLGNPALKDHFLIYTFGVALVLCIIICIVRRQKPGLAELGFGVLLGVPNYLSTRFLIMSLTDVPAVIAYPTYSAGTIVLVTLVGMIGFREKLGRRKLIALGIILAALVLLNL